MEKHELIHMLHCFKEQLGGKPASSFPCEGCPAKDDCEGTDFPSLLNISIRELEQTLPEERSAWEFATYTGGDFKNGLRHGSDYRLRIEIHGGVYHVFSRNAPIGEKETLTVYTRLAEFINDWSFFS